MGFVFVGLDKCSVHVTRFIQNTSCIHVIHLDPAIAHHAKSQLACASKCIIKQRAREHYHALNMAAHILVDQTYLQPLQPLAIM